MNHGPSRGPFILCRTPSLEGRREKAVLSTIIELQSFFRVPLAMLPCGAWALFAYRESFVVMTAIVARLWRDHERINPDMVLWCHVIALAFTSYRCSYIMLRHPTGR